MPLPAPRLRQLGYSFHTATTGQNLHLMPRNEVDNPNPLILCSCLYAGSASLSQKAKYSCCFDILVFAILLKGIKKIANIPINLENRTPQRGDKMARNCPHCDSEMFEEYDHINRVRVLVCSRPTCLFRSYPDYPRRKSNEEVCYKCQSIFKVRQNDTGILCPECKAVIEQNKKGQGSAKEQKPFKAAHGETFLRESPKAKLRRAV